METGCIMNVFIIIDLLRHIMRVFIILLYCMHYVLLLLLLLSFIHYTIIDLLRQPRVVRGQAPLGVLT